MSHRAGSERFSHGDTLPFGISDDGRTMAFISTANDLVAGDTSPVDQRDVFIYDGRHGRATLASRAASGGPASGGSWPAVLSPDGEHLIFQCGGTNLGFVDANGDVGDTYVFARSTKRLRLANPSFDDAGRTSDRGAYPVSVTNGGQVVFASFSTDLTGEAPSTDTPYTYRFDATSGLVERLGP